MPDDDDTLAEDFLQARMDLAEVLRTVEGRRFLRRLLTEAGLYELAPTGLDPQALVYKAAQRDFGLLIVAMVNSVDPRAFTTLTREAAEDAIRAQAKANKGVPE